MVKCNKSAKVPESLAKEKLKGENGSCTCDDVINQLFEDFNSKCYICELKDISDPEVEHLRPHYNGKDLDLKFDWSNLFLSCSHCNKVKNKSKYENKIIDCCNEDPENHIRSVYENGNVCIIAKDNDEFSVRTAELIYETFNRESPALRNKASQHRLNALKKEMATFFKTLYLYNKDNGNNIQKRKLKIMLARSSAFAAFKREYIREHAETYRALYELL